MKNPYHFKKAYKLSNTKEAFLFDLKNVTAIGTINPDRYMKSHKFVGEISEKNFEVQAIPSTRTRKLFNPLIIGNFSEGELTVELKLIPFDYIFVALYFIVCILFGVIIYNHSLENDALLPFVFIIPTIIFLAIILVFSFFAKINYSDAIYSIENIIAKSS